MEALPAYLDSPAGKKEETSRAVTMLMQMCEFEEFKEMMMYVKKVLEKSRTDSCARGLLVVRGRKRLFIARSLME